ncbi:MAG: ATP cone domain-containing protein [Planctomycetota bacterium]
MYGSWTIRVIKRDGCEEDFDAAKLAASIHLAMLQSEGTFHDASHLALAARIYLARSGVKRISSAAMMEMVMKALRCMGMAPAAAAMDAYHAWRCWRRGRIRIVHEGGQTTLCDKGWLSELACRSWNLSQRTGRIMAAEVERDLLAGNRDELWRDEVQDMINWCVAAFGLADAVPVEFNAQPG